MLSLEPIVVLTGAGVSAASGVPTFRGQDGIWQNYRPEQLATPEAFQRDPELVWRFYSWRREIVHRSQPNQAHVLLAKLERAHQDFHLITQNVDGLHQVAGSENVIELHGSLWSLKCSSCSSVWQDDQVPFPEFPPTCPHCGENARPNVVWFGETLDPKILEISFELSAKARTMVVIGTSAIVHPAAQIPLVAQANGALLTEINPEETPLSSRVDKVYRMEADLGLQNWLMDHQYEL